MDSDPDPPHDEHFEDIVAELQREHQVNGRTKTLFQRKMTQARRNLEEELQNKQEATGTP